MRFAQMKVNLVQYRRLLNQSGKCGSTSKHLRTLQRDGAKDDHQLVLHEKFDGFSRATRMSKATIMGSRATL